MCVREGHISIAIANHVKFYSFIVQHCSIFCVGVSVTYSEGQKIYVIQFSVLMELLVPWGVLDEQVHSAYYRNYFYTSL